MTVASSLKYRIYFIILSERSGAGQCRGLFILVIGMPLYLGNCLKIVCLPSINSLRQKAERDSVAISRIQATTEIACSLLAAEEREQIIFNINYLEYGVF